MNKWLAESSVFTTASWGAADVVWEDAKASERQLVDALGSSSARALMSVKELYEEFPFPSKENPYDFVGRYVLPYAPERPMQILDAGCGTGHMTVMLAKRFPSARVLGVDFSENSLAEARLLAQSRRVSNVDFRYQDLMNEFPSGERRERYDFAVSIGCLHHTPNPAIALRHIRAVLSKEAVFILGVYGKYGRVETEMRRQLVDFLREVTGRSFGELIPVCKAILSEPVLRENSFFKMNVFLMPFTNPRRFVSLVKRFLLGKVGVATFRKSDISLADSYVHPLVLSWTAREWLEAIESAGFGVKRFIYDLTPAAMCVPWNATTRIRDRELRSLLEGMSPNTRYEAFDRIFRPSFHIFACEPIS